MSASATAIDVVVVVGEEEEGGGGKGATGVFRLKRLMSSYTDTIKTEAGAIARMRGPRPLRSPFGPLSAIKIRYSDLPPGETKEERGEKRGERRGNGGDQIKNAQRNKERVRKTKRRVTETDRRRQNETRQAGYMKHARHTHPPREEKGDARQDKHIIFWSGEAERRVLGVGVEWSGVLQTAQRPAQCNTLFSL